jgi:benzoyl-CoA reductase/2-hydroxyglutaryl-CoA dehydratase subunit BcrC/BadD/HgdB
MAKEEKKKRINRLKSMYPLRAQVDGTYERAVASSKANRPTAWSMVTWWCGDPILKTMGVDVVYPEDYGAVCAAFGTAPAYLERSDSDGFPSHMCGYLRNCIGYAARMMDLGGQIPPEAPMAGMPKPWLFICSGALCDARYKGFQSLGRYLDAPVWTLEIPHPGVKAFMTEGVAERDVHFITEELREFVTFLERLLGKKMDWDKLEEMIEDTIEMNRIWYEVNQLRKAKPCPMHARDFWSCMPASLYMAGNPKETIALYRKMYDEVKDMVDNHIGALPVEEKYRLAFAELPPWHDLGFFDDLAERGWIFPYESWNYHPPKPIDLTGVKDPLERIARYHYNWLTGYYTDAFKNKEWWGYFAYPYLEKVREYKCDGVLLHPLLTCRTATNHLMYVQEMLMRRLKVPSIIAEGDIVDLKLFNHADALSKAEPFEESMEHYRKVRKEEGFDW